MGRTLLYFYWPAWKKIYDQEGLQKEIKKLAIKYCLYLKKWVVSIYFQPFQLTMPDENQLTLDKVFESKSSAWKIYLYKTL